MIRKLFAAVLTSVAMALPTMAQFTSAPAFPGAEGYGRYTTGGRGGAVYHVTSLEDDPADPQDGTLRYFITKKNGPRIIVFDVAGNIELQADLKIAKGDVSILGQTAPGDGICLKNYPLKINADNVIVRFVRCRLGDMVDDDAMSASHHDDAICKNIIIDHCSLSWCTDEVGSFYGNENFTLQWCILSESLRANVAKGTNHGFGGIWGGSLASFHHNLLAHNDSRMPRLDHDYVSTQKGPVDLVNNVVYNWGGNSTYGGESCNTTGEYKTFNFINNYYKAGPATGSSKRNRFIDITDECDNCREAQSGSVVPPHFYLSGNTINGQNVLANSTYINNYRAKCFHTEKFESAAWKAANGDYPTVSTHSAAKAFDAVVSYAGASFARDVIDTRIANETKTGTSSTKGSNGSSYGLIDAVKDAGGWPTLTGTAKKDTDGDGMPDEWEIANGLNPNVANANKFNLDSKRYYTNIEVYANSLVENIVKAEREGADQTFEEYYPDMKNGENETVVVYSMSDSPVITKCVKEVSPCVAEFADNAKLVLNGNLADKNYSNGSAITYEEKQLTSVKLSNGAQNTFYAPEDKWISEVKIVSYKHGSGTRTCFWREINGVAYGELPEGETTWVPFEGTQLLDNGTPSAPDVQTVAFPGNVQSFTFTNIGEQLGFALVVTYADTDAVVATKGTDNRMLDGKRRNLAGQEVGKNYKGIVIVNGSKYNVK